MHFRTTTTRNTTLYIWYENHSFYNQREVIFTPNSVYNINRVPRIEKLFSSAIYTNDPSLNL